MSRRLLEFSPSELTKLNKQEFLNGIRLSEGRVVGAYVCPYAANYVEKVANVELVAAFGADFVTLEGYDPSCPQFTGLPSRKAEDDHPFRDRLQVQMGTGWSIREIKQLIGRPIGCILLVNNDFNEEYGGIYSKSVYTPELAENLINQGYDFICLCGFGPKNLVKAVKDISTRFGTQIVIEAGIPHGPGSINGDFPPFNLREYITVDLVSALAQAGADIVDLPAVGVVPGFSSEYVSRLVDQVHAHGSLAACSIAHSLESSSKGMLERIVADNKICGVDLYNVAAGGVYESVALPEALMDICIAAKGKRHTYRRMAQSPAR